MAKCICGHEDSEHEQGYGDCTECDCEAFEQDESMEETETEEDTDDSADSTDSSEGEAPAKPMEATEPG